MSERIDLNNQHRFADCSVGNISGNTGIGHSRLIMSLELDLQPWTTGDDKPGLEIIEGHVKLEGQPLGIAHPSNPGVVIRPYEYSHDTQVVLELPLTWSQVCAIEDLRCGGDMNLEVWPKGRFWWSGRDETFSCHPIKEKVTQSDWAVITQSMKIRRTVLIEVIEPIADAPPALTKAIEHMEEAQVHMHAGQWRAAIIACRHVLEALAALDDADQTELKKQEKDKKGRSDAIRRALKDYTHAAAHVGDDATSTLTFEREDAQAMITMVAGLLVWYRQ